MQQVYTPVYEIVPATDLARVRSRARTVLSNEGFIPADELRGLLRDFLTASSDLPGGSDTGTLANSLPVNVAPMSARGLEKDLRAMARRLEELEQALMRQETELSFSQRIARMGSWSYDLSTNEIWWSEEMCRLFGFEEGETELDFSQFFERLHPEDRDAWLHAVEEASQEGHEYELHFRAQLPNGTIRHLLGKGAADFGEDGGVWRVFGTAQELNVALSPSSGKEGAEEAAAAAAAEAQAPRGTVKARAGRKPGAAEKPNSHASPAKAGAARARITMAKPKAITQPLSLGSAFAGMALNRTPIPPAPTVAAPDPDDPAAGRLLAKQISANQQEAAAGKFSEVQSMIGMWELDLNSGTMRWSEAMAVILELPSDTPPSLDRLLTLLNDTSRREFENALQRMVISGEGFFMQVSLPPAPGQKKGTPRLCLVSARMQGLKASGSEFKMLGTLQNVTGWAQA